MKLKRKKKRKKPFSGDKAWVGRGSTWLVSEGRQKVSLSGNGLKEKNSKIKIALCKISICD